MSKSKKSQPATVSFTAKQAGETQAQFPFGEENSRWAWVESSVWTDRMLTALENGVKGGKWFSLIDKVYSLANLESAAKEVAGNGGAAGVDRVTTEKAVVADLNRTLPGWFGYFQYSHWTTFRPLDAWIRMRLRSILRKHQKKRGRGRGSDHQRWPNAYFAELGLFSLETAHASVSQSALR